MCRYLGMGRLSLGSTADVPSTSMVLLPFSEKLFFLQTDRAWRVRYSEHPLLHMHLPFMLLLRFSDEPLESSNNQS